MANYMDHMEAIYEVKEQCRGRRGLAGEQGIGHTKDDALSSSVVRAS